MYKLFMAFRYLRAHKIIYFSIAGVALGIMTMVVVTSIMGGFSRDMRQRIRGLQSDLVVNVLDDKLYITRYEEACAAIAKVPHVRGCAPRLEYEARLGRRGNQRNVHLVGILPEREEGVSDIGRYFAEGTKRTFDFNREDGQPVAHPAVVMGIELSAYGLGPASLMTALFSGPFPEPLTMTVEEVGRFKTGMAEYDTTYVFMHLRDLQKFLQVDDPPRVNALAVKLDDYDRTGLLTRGRVLEALHAFRPCVNVATHRFGQCGPYKVLTWEQSKRILLQAVDVEKGIQIIIMFLIIMVAGFNIIAIYTLVVRSKSRDIGVLRALGASEQGVISIFLMSGGLCGLIGSIFGIILGLLLSSNLNAIHEFIRVVSREMNRLPRGTTSLAALAVGAAAAALIWTWFAFYKSPPRRPWLRMALTGLLLGVAAYAATAWVDGYGRYDRFDPKLGESFRPALVAWVVGIWGLFCGLWLLLDTYRQRPSWIFFGFFGTVVFIAYSLGLLATNAIADAILATRPLPGWPGLALFPREIYYLEAIPVFVDYNALTFIVAITLVVSFIFSIYPALRAAKADPIEAIRDAE